MKKIRVEWLAAVLVVLAVAAVLIFLLVLTLNPNTHEADIRLPENMGIDGENGAGTRPREAGDNAHPVELTTHNVKNVIRTLKRPENYHMLVESVVSYREESRVMTAQQWVSAESTVTRVTDSLTGRVLCTLRKDGRLTSWYEGDDRVLDDAAASLSSDILAGIPTYESILELADNEITAADYRFWDDTPCIYVEQYDRELDYSDRYYVSIEDGMLIRAETYTDGELVYSMSLLAFTEDLSGSAGIVPPTPQT